MSVTTEPFAVRPQWRSQNDCFGKGAFARPARGPADATSNVSARRRRKALGDRARQAMTDVPFMYYTHLHR
jgi:hypothetical protein